MIFHRVVVTGLGAITPVGNTAPEFWSAILAGKSGAGPITQFDSSRHKTHFACEVKGYEPDQHFDKKESRKLDRFIQFAIVAAREAVKDSGIDLAKIDLDEFGIFIGSGIGGLDFLEEQTVLLNGKGPDRVSPFLIPRLIANMAAGQVSIQLGLRGPNSCAVTACASANNSIGDAFKTIQRGQAIAMIAGGTEAVITPLAVAGFENMRALSSRNEDPKSASRPFDKDRDGFVIGEGAGILLLEEYEHAKARGAKIYAEVVGYGASGDAHHMTAPAPDGNGASRAMRMALRDSGLPATEVNYLSAHATSTPLGDKAEVTAIKSAFGEQAGKLAITATKSMFGHMLGAAGGAQGVSCVLAIHHGVIPPTINLATLDPDCAGLDFVPNTSRQLEVTGALSNSFGFGGHNATVLFRKLIG